MILTGLEAFPRSSVSQVAKLRPFGYLVSFSVLVPVPAGEFHDLLYLQKHMSLGFKKEGGERQGTRGQLGQTGRGERRQKRGEKGRGESRRGGHKPADRTLNVERPASHIGNCYGIF